ncbi:hypothetical protein Tco_0761960 [Tanacetum coccineum]
MAVLDSCPKHNMVAYLEKSEGNAEFHEIIDFLTRSSIHHALTVSPVVSTTFVEQFWTSAKSKIINNVRHITAKVAGKPVSISEASIRSDLLFDDANGIDSLPNQAIFDAIQLMGYEGDLTTDPSPRPSPSTIIPDSILESSGGNLGGHSSSDKSLSGNEGEMTLQSVYDLCLSLCAQVSDQAKEIQHLKAQIKKLKKQAKPVIKHHRAWMQSVSLKQRLARKRSSKKQWVHKESVSKQGRKFAKGEPSVHRDPLFDDIPEDTLDHMETENAQVVGRTRDIVGEEKEIDENILSTEDVLSTDKEKVSTDKEKVSTDRPIVSTDGSKVSTDRQIESTDEQRKGTEDHTEEGSATQATQTPTSTIFGDDETIAKVLLNMSQAKAVSREKEKGVELKDIEETDRPRPTSTRSLLTLKPLPKIDPKDKGKKKIEEEDESESESDGTMAVLDSCPKHNMVAYLEKSEGNAEFHEIIDFLKRSSIHHALTVSPVVSTTFVEQFWTSAKSKIINNVRHITAKVAGKSVSISEASIRSDLLFDDADGIDSLPNQAIFDAIQLMGYEGDLTVLTFNKALFSPQWRFLFHTMNHCLSSKSTSWDQIPTNIATAVICLTSNQKYNFSKLIFDGMLRHLDAKKKFFESDEEMARKMQEEWEGKEERNRIAEEKATNEALIRNFDDINARIEADKLLAEKLQEQEREQFTIEERAKFLHDTIAAQRKFLAQQRSEAIRNRPPTKNQLRNQMMTYLKHVGNFKHSELKIKKFEEIQVLYEKIKRLDEDFISIGSAEDERLIKRMNEKGVDSSKSEVIKEKSKEEAKEENK